MKAGFTIGDLASRCGVSRDTLRFYERERLLPAPPRSPSGYRVFGEADAARIRFIRRARATGLTLDDIRELLRLRELRTPDNCSRVAARLRSRIEALDRKVASSRPSVASWRGARAVRRGGGVVPRDPRLRPRRG